MVFIHEFLYLLCCCHREQCGFSQQPSEFCPSCSIFHPFDCPHSLFSSSNEVFFILFSNISQHIQAWLYTHMLFTHYMRLQRGAPTSPHLLNAACHSSNAEKECFISYVPVGWTILSLSEVPSKISWLALKQGSRWQLRFLSDMKWKMWDNILKWCGYWQQLRKCMVFLDIILLQQQTTAWSRTNDSYESILKWVILKDLWI